MQHRPAGDAAVPNRPACALRKASEGSRMITVLAYLMVIVFMTLIMTGRLPALLSLILVPTAFALLAGFGGSMGPMMLEGIRSLAPTGVMLLFAILYFGIMIDANMEVGLCHPPVGLNLYVASGITKMSISELTVAVVPWLLTMLVFLVIVTYWPGLSLWLPKAMGLM